MRKIHANVIFVSYTGYHLYKKCELAQVTNSAQKKSCALPEK